MKKQLQNVGFTLMEVMVSIIIITIAFFAMLVTQGVAVDGFVATRDLSAASDVARTVVETMQIEGASWTSGGFDTLILHPYADATKPFAHDNLLETVQDAKWGWVSLNVTPIDARLASGANVPGRFCTFARGGFVEMDITTQNTMDPMSGDLVGSPMWRSQIAVVYPGPNGNLSACADILVAELDASNPALLEIKGLRASYFGTMLVRREWN